jgi:hypothetical protein
MLLVAFSLPPDDRLVNKVKKHIEKMDKSLMLVARWPDTTGRIKTPVIGTGRRT